MDYLEGSMGFTSDLGIASHYGSEYIAKVAIDKVSVRGFKMNLEVKELKITYTVSEVAK